MVQGEIALQWQAVMSLFRSGQRGRPLWQAFLPTYFLIIIKSFVCISILWEACMNRYNSEFPKVKDVHGRLWLQSPRNRVQASSPSHPPTRTKEYNR
jgi:hypothetical protein